MDTSPNFVCTACSCLCDDIEIEFDGTNLKHISKACARGVNLFNLSESGRRNPVAQVSGNEVLLDEAVETASQLLKKSRRPVVFGLDNSTTEAQEVGIRLAQKLEAVIDDCSSFCHGALIENIIKGVIPTCMLSQIRDNADLLLYWGSNPYHSHPRHMARFSYYSYTDYIEAGWIPKTTLSCIEVRDTELTALCKPAFRLKPGEDRDFIQLILDEVQGESSSEKARDFVRLVRESCFCVIFAGLGLTYSLDNDFSLFTTMIQQFNQSTQIAVIPMVGHFNMRGFNQSLYSKTGYVNKVAFTNGIIHGDQFSFFELLRTEQLDCVLIVGSDPFSSLPGSLIANLRHIPLICIDAIPTLTTKYADVVFGTAISGLESGGTAVRMDGEEVALIKGVSCSYPSDADVLSMLLEALAR